MNETWDGHNEGEEGHGHDVNYIDESWNDYDNHNNWDWNDNSYEDAANYIRGINEPTSDKQSHHRTSTNPNRLTQHHGTTTAKAVNNSYKRTQHNCTST